MNNEELVKHFKGILTGSASEQDTQNFTQMLIQIAKEGYGERKPNPTYEALETLDDFLEELDEFYGLAALQYGSEAYHAMGTLHSYYNKQSDKDEVIEYLLDMLEEEHMGMRAVAVKEISDKFGIEL
jgi:hypothetical protein